MRVTCLTVLLITCLLCAEGHVWMLQRHPNPNDLRDPSRRQAADAAVYKRFGADLYDRGGILEENARQLKRRAIQTKQR